jgi:prophage tail gpP-like protein
MAFEISVNNKLFTNWESAKVARTIDENCGTFRFSSSSKTPAPNPVRAGDAVQIVLNGKPIVTGFCDVVESRRSDGSSLVTVAGRDNTADIIDSSMPDVVKSLEGPISMVALCERVIAALGADIPVIQTATGIGEFSDEVTFMADAGTNCMEYLTDFARELQVYLISDGAGSLDVFRPPETLLAGSVISLEGDMRNNVKGSSAKIDHSMRFNQYSVRSQDNFGGDPFADYEDGIDRQGEATDDKIRASRFLEVQGEESMDDTTSANRAIEEMNIRLARSTVYRATLQGVERAPGVLWDIGQLTRVMDTFNGFEGIFLVRSVSYEVDLRAGTRTELTLAPPEAYNVRIPTQGDDRRAQQGDSLQNNDVADEKQRFTR